MIHDSKWFMCMAIREAEKAYKNGEVPVGAIIVNNNEIIAKGHNEKEAKNNPIMHAEMVTISKAAKKTGWRLNECDMYVTLEPCLMCAGAILQARIRRLFIGTMDPKAGAAGSILNVFTINKFNHKVEVIYGIMEDNCSELLKEFFRDLRCRGKK